jgi:hypothetical protein
MRVFADYKLCVLCGKLRFNFLAIMRLATIPGQDPDLLLGTCTFVKVNNINAGQVC